MLQHFPGDVQRQVLGIHQPGYEAEMVRQQIGALVHDQHAAGIQLQPLLIFAGVVIIGGRAGDEQQGIVKWRPSVLLWMTRTGSSKS